MSNSKRKTLAPFSPTNKKILDALESVFNYQKLPAYLVLKFSLLCSDCGQSVNTRTCDPSDWCLYDYDEENDTNIVHDFGKEVCEDCSKECIHCNDKVICEECFDSCESQDGYSRFYYGEPVHGDDFACRGCEDNFVYGEDYEVKCHLCSVISDKCIRCFSTENLTSSESMKSSEAIKLCKDCLSSFK